MQIRDPGWKKFGSGLRDKHPGSATLLPWIRILGRIGCGSRRFLDLNKYFMDSLWCSLCLLAPEMIIPELLEKLTLASESLTEPHRFHVCIQVRFRLAFLHCSTSLIIENVKSVWRSSFQLQWQSWITVPSFLNLNQQKVFFLVWIFLLLSFFLCFARVVCL